MAIPGAFAAASVRTSGGFQFLARRSSVDVYVSDKDDEQLLCLAFRPENKIHLFPPSKQTVRLLRDTVKEHWTIDSENPTLTCYTMFLEGTPFLIYTRREKSLLMKYICCLILEQFKTHGWELVVCTDLSSKTDLTTWYFTRVPTEDESGQSARAKMDNSTSLVCLSLSAKRKLQLINASKLMQKLLRDLVEANYEPGLDHDAHYGRDYQIKLKGTPWDTNNSNEIVAACRLIIAAFRGFGANGYHLYGLVNLKDTADSFFFEYNPVQTFYGDHYMIMALDEHNIVRFVNVSSRVVGVIKETIDHYWPPGLEAEGRIGIGKRHSLKDSSIPPKEEPISWEFVLKGSPWRATASKIGRSRQFVTYLLDTLLTCGWTVVTGLDMSRSLHKKSALLFQRCPPMKDLRHVCLSPVGEQNYQLIHAPPSLRELVRKAFGHSVIHDKLTDDESIHELVLDGKSWWVADPEHERDSFIIARRRMGRLLETLMASHWRVVASADVAQETSDDESTGKGEGIHSWFVMYFGHDEEKSGEKPSILQAGGRIGGMRGALYHRYARPPVTRTSSAAAAPRSQSISGRPPIACQQREASPPAYEISEKMKERRRSGPFATYRAQHNL